MFYLTIHKRLFSLSIDHGIAGAGGREKWSTQGLDIHQGHDTGTHFPGAVLQDLKAPLTQCLWSQLY